MCTWANQPTTTCAGSIGTQRQPSCSSGAEQAADDELRAPTMAGAPELCLPVLKLAQVSFIDRPRPRSVLLCVPAPCLSSTAQPDLRLHSVGGRRLSEATLEPLSMAARRQRAAAAWRHAGACGADRVVPPRCASVAGEGRVRRPDGRVSSSLPLSAGWPVRPDPLPSCVAHRVSRSVLECVCGVICEIVRTWPT